MNEQKCYQESIHLTAKRLSDGVVHIANGYEKVGESWFVGTICNSVIKADNVDIGEEKVTCTRCLQNTQNDTTKG